MLSTRGLAYRFAPYALLLGLLAVAGCSGETPSKSSPSTNSKDAAGTAAPSPAATPSPAVASAAASTAVAALSGPAAETRETWDIVTIQGSRVGYVHTRVERGQHNGLPAVRIEGLNHLVLTRGGDRSSQEIRFVSLETPDGKLIEFQTETQFGQAPMRTAGRVAGEQLLLETSSLTKTEKSSIPWPSDCGGMYAVELALERSPMQPGQTRQIRSLLPGLNVPVTSSLAAQRYESVQLLSGNYDLLRIETQVQFPDGTKLPGVVWADRTGEILKNFSELLNLETYRATKAQALDEKDVGSYDLMAKLSVPLSKPMTLGHASKRVRYRLSLEGKDPAALLVSCASQQIQSIDPHTAEVTVTALRPDTKIEKRTDADGKVGTDERRPSSHIQSDDPVIVAMAQQASAGAGQDPWSVVVALERYVKQNITRKDFSQAFATAAEVARSRQGDCTEHALLLAALARACGIPARVAVGLVYVEGSGVFGYHMWTEVFVSGTWIPVDSTLGRGGIGAGHLKLAQSSLQGGDAFSSFLPVLNVMGRLKIEVLSEE